MDEMGIGLLILLGIAIASLAIYLSWLAAKKRREALAAVAGRLGWQFDPSRDTGHDDEYAHFEVFRRGHSRAAFNTLTGKIEIDGRSFPGKMGDFTYKVTRQTDKGPRTRTYRFSYLILHLPFRSVPDLLIRREGIFDKLAGAIGFDDIDFESAEFSKRFFVKSGEKKFAYDVVHPRMIEFLLDNPFPGVDIEKGRCCVTDGRRRWKPEEFEPTLKWLSRFFGLWPEHLTTRLEA